MCYLPFFTKDFTVLLLMIGVILSQDLDHRAETILQLAQRAQRARCEPKVPQFWWRLRKRFCLGILKTAVILGSARPFVSGVLFSNTGKMTYSPGFLGIDPAVKFFTLRVYLHPGVLVGWLVGWLDYNPFLLGILCFFVAMWKTSRGGNICENRNSSLSRKVPGYTLC